MLPLSWCLKLTSYAWLEYPNGMRHSVFRHSENHMAKFSLLCGLWTRIRK